jgi:hypothetical protein
MANLSSGWLSCKNVDFAGILQSSWLAQASVRIPGLTTMPGLIFARRAAAQDAASSIQDQVAGMPAAAQAPALLQTLTAALSKSVASDKGGKR